MTEDYRTQSEKELMHFDTLQSKGFVVPDMIPVENDYSNNGHAHTQNIAHIWHRYFRHRTQAEARITEELAIRELTFSPLPVFSTKYQHRVELDFIVLQRSWSLIVEIDGDSHFDKSAFDEEERLRAFEEELIPKIRFRSPPTPNPIWAKTVVDRIEERFEKIISTHGYRRYDEKNYCS